MIEITGYKFNNMNAFNSARALVNTHFGIPVNKEAVTRNYIDVSISYKEDYSIDFYYVAGNIAPVLGFPIVFNVREPNIF